PKAHAVFEEHFHAYGPELMIVVSRVFTENRLTTPLHFLENRTRHTGEIMKLLLEMSVLIGACNKIHICQGMGHFVQSHIAAVVGTTDSLEKCMPGKINPRAVDMAYERQ